MLKDVLTKLYSGESVDVTVSLSDYASTTYSLSYVFRGERDAIEVGCSSNADGTWTLSLDAAQTVGLTHGDYSYFGYVSSGGAKSVADTGNLEIIADPTAETWAQARLSAIEAAIAGRASDNQLTTQIAGTQLQYMSADQLIKWRGYFLAEVKREHRKMQEDIGVGSGRFIYPEFRG